MEKIRTYSGRDTLSKAQQILDDNDIYNNCIVVGENAYKAPTVYQLYVPSKSIDLANKLLEPHETLEKQSVDAISMGFEKTVVLILFSSILVTIVYVLYNNMAVIFQEVIEVFFIATMCFSVLYIVWINLIKKEI